MQLDSIEARASTAIGGSSKEPGQHPRQRSDVWKVRVDDPLAQPKAQRLQLAGGQQLREPLVIDRLEVSANPFVIERGKGRTKCG